VARGAGDVFLATTENIVCWRAAPGPVLLLGDPRPGRVTALSVDPAGEVVYALHTDGPQFLLSCFAADRAGRFAKMGELAGVTRGEPAAEVCYLQPCPSFRNGDYRVTLSVPDGRQTLVGRYLTPQAHAEPFRTQEAATRLLLDTASAAWEWADGLVERRLLAPGGGAVSLFRWREPWPAAPGGLTDWIGPGSTLEVCGIDREGCLWWAEFDTCGETESRLKHHTSPGSERYHSACLIGPGVVAAVNERNEVHWLRVAAAGLERWAVTRLGVPARAFAVVARTAANEVVVVLADGSAIRLPRP
jgi:hypothetical protein